MAKAYRLHDSSKNSIKETRDVLFDENVSKNSGGIREEDAVQNDVFSFCFVNDEVESHDEEHFSPE